MSNRKFLGWVFMIVGLVILLTPFTPGSVLLIIGADMVFGNCPEWKKLKEKVVKFFWK